VAMVTKTKRATSKIVINLELPDDPDDGVGGVGGGCGITVGSGITEGSGWGLTVGTGLNEGSLVTCGVGLCVGCVVDLLVGSTAGPLSDGQAYFDIIEIVYEHFDVSSTDFTTPSAISLAHVTTMEEFLDNPLGQFDLPDIGYDN
jgi:hypothetical protein